MSDDTSLRLNKHLAFQLGISRREADTLIEEGRVTVDGNTAVLGARIPTAATILVNGKPLAGRTHFTYVLFHKPVGYICSRRRQGEVETIYSLVPEKYHHLKPVGRLDKDSSGLLILSDDGDFAQQMTHPRYYKQKTYEVELDRDLEPLHQQMINDFGVQLDDGPSKLTLARLSDDERRSWHVIMSEGRNRQIRRTFAALGYEVTRLHRTDFGSYSLGDIKPGKLRKFIIH